MRFSIPCIIKFNFLYPFWVTKPGLVYCHLCYISHVLQRRLSSNHSAAPFQFFLSSFLPREKQTQCTWSIKSHFQVWECRTLKNLKTRLTWLAASVDALSRKTSAVQSWGPWRFLLPFTKELICPWAWDRDPSDWEGAWRKVQGHIQCCKVNWVLR